MTAFLDTNVVIALLDPDDMFHEWAVESVEARKLDGPMIVSDIVYCEVSVAMNNREEMDEAITSLGLDRIRGSDDAMFRAGKAFKQYKEQNKGPKLGVLPDFIVGAIAETEQLPLLTTNAKDFVAYFTGVEIVVPPNEADKSEPASAAE